MPSPRSSPSVRPSSPRAGSYKTAPSHYDVRQPPSPRAMHSRSHQPRRPPTNSLQLPALPRFHPANFPSNHSSAQSTPDGAPSPQGPMSPRVYQRIYNDAQKQLYLHQREMLSAAARSSGSPTQVGKPVSPRLAPLGSPGPVTPLELEHEEGYLTAGARNASNGIAVSDELVEKMIRDEVRRQRTSSSSS